MTTRRSTTATVGDRRLSTVDALAQLSFLVHEALERRAAEHGLSMVQTRLLGVLRDRAPTMNELATLLQLDKSSITGLVARAERRGLVTRTPSTTDRRAIRVDLTPDGRALVGKVATAFAHDVADFTSPLAGGDRDRLTLLVSRLLAGHATQRGIDLFPQ